MKDARDRNIQELEGVLHSVAGALSHVHVAVLVEHPEAVRLALAAVADVLSSEHQRASSAEAEIEWLGDAESQKVDARESDTQLSSRSRPGRMEELLTSEELAARVGLKTRQSVHDWRRKGRIVGWQGAKRGYVFPAGQFDRSGKPLDGLDRIVPHFSDGYTVWIWLNTPRPSLSGAKPIVLLGKGEGDRVVAAAEGDAQGDFA